MIIEKTFNNEPLRVSYIEEFIKSQGIEPVRYAITGLKEGFYILNVSGIEY